MYRNFRYGDPALQVVNTFLFTSYIVSMISFYFIAGGIADGMAAFTGQLGMSVALNRGVRPRPPAAKPVNIPFRRDNVRRYVNSPAFQRSLQNVPPR
jgi:hypothetical protein